MEKNKTLWIVAGANGAGKTTFVNKYASKLKEKLLFVSPDDVAKKIDPSYDGRDGELIAKAGRETIAIQRKLLEEGKSFGYETTFSGKRDLKVIEQAQKKGYSVKLVYIGLNSSLSNTMRVKDRVLNGGHHVDPKDIQRRYPKSMENLAKALEKADSAFIYDNSQSKHKIVARFKERELVKVGKEIPLWVKEHLPELERQLVSKQRSTKEQKIHSPETVKQFMKQKANEKPAREQTKGRDRG